MPVIESQIDPRSAEFQANAAQLRGVVDDLKKQLAQTALGGGDKARNKHTERGKLLPRERIRGLLDPGSPFLEFSPLAAHGMYEDQAPCAGMIAGIGRVHGSEVVVVANDATVKGGTYFPITVKKSICARRKSRWKTTCPASTWSIRAAPSCRCRTRYFPTRNTSGGFSTTRRD